MKLSILICTTDTRVRRFLPDCIDRLREQLINVEGVELLYLGDNKTRSVGKKRNDLIKLAQGEFFCFVDDDDKLTDDYVSTILDGIKDSPDLFVFRAFRHHNGMKDREVVYSVAFEKDENGFPYKRIPNHLMVWKKSLVAHIPFDEVNYGEDSS